EQLADADEWVRRAAVIALAPLVSQDDDVRRRVVAHLDDPSSSVRIWAVSAMENIVANEDGVRARIMNMIDDADRRVCQRALRVLAPLSSIDDGIRSRILDARAGSFEGVRLQASVCLFWDRDPDIRREALRVTMAALRSSDEDLRNLAATSLGTLDP